MYVHKDIEIIIHIINSIYIYIDIATVDMILLKVPASDPQGMQTDPCPFEVQGFARCSPKGPQANLDVCPSQWPDVCTAQKVCNWFPQPKP